MSNSPFWSNRLKMLFKVIDYSDLYLLAERGFNSLTEEQIQILYGSDFHYKIKKQFKKINDLTNEEMERKL